MTGRSTGVGRYLSEILRAWGGIGAAAAHDFILCASEPVAVPGSPLRVSSLTMPGHGTMWEQRTLPALIRRAKADVLFAPAYTAPLWCRVPTVLTIHDVSFAAHPEWFSWREGFRRRTLARASARRAARIITESDFSKREIVRHLRVDPSRIDVIYLGAPLAPPPAPREPVVLYVGSLFNRRHLPVVIEGFARIAHRHATLRLEMVGENRTFPGIDIDAAIARSGAADRIRWRPYVADGDLSSLYARASAFIFLSEYEGFGLTPLEAIAAGVPPIVLGTEVAHEIYGTAAEYVNRPEAALVAATLERVLTDEATRTRLLAAGAALVERYSWSECAQRTLQVLLSVGPALARTAARQPS